LQDHLYDAASGWLIDPAAPLPRFFLYRLPKVSLWIFGLGVLLLAAGPAAWRGRWGLARRDLWVLFAALALIPLTVGAVKSVSRVPCPYELSCYGGSYPYVKLFSAYTPEERPETPGRCFPAAQASGGFALMGLLAIGTARRRYLRGFLIGSAAGWFLGLYQMARGAHFLSHTLTSWLWAWLLAVLLDHFWPRPAGEEA
jgi:membrane-associated PAP2 superfamily phosphatase